MVAGFYETLDGIIKRDRRWLLSLLDYVCYTPNPAIQAQAVHIAIILNRRLPQLPDLLLQPIAAGSPLLLDRLKLCKFSPLSYHIVRTEAPRQFAKCKPGYRTQVR